MRGFSTLLQALRSRRWAPIVGALGIVAALSGCVIYPAGGGGGGHYWHRDFR
jgi:hypothetical protein